MSHVKGFAYVEMKSLESLPLVLQLNDRVPDFQKFPVMVKASEAEKNYLAKQASPPTVPPRSKRRWNALCAVRDIAEYT